MIDSNIPGSISETVYQHLIHFCMTLSDVLGLLLIYVTVQIKQEFLYSSSTKPTT